MIPVVTTYKFLGLIFDNKLSWKPHINAVYNKCSRLLPLFYKMTRLRAAPSIASLLIMYKTLVRNIIDYGLIIYSTAAKSNLAKLDRLQNTFLRIILGSFPSTPLRHLYLETGIETIALRAIWLSMTYVIKLRSDKSNPNNHFVDSLLSNNCSFSSRNVPCLLQAINELKKCNFRMTNITSNSYIAPPWEPNPIQVIFSPISKTQALSCPAEANALYLQIVEKFSFQATHIYCDGSYSENHNRASASFFIPQLNISKSWTLRTGSSILSAELSAIDVALNTLYHLVHVEEEVVIFSDSSSALKILKSKSQSHPIAMSIINTIYNYKSAGTRVTFVWIPSHVGIRHNETVDSLAQTENKNPSGLIQNALSFSEKKHIAKKQ